MDNKDKSQSKLDKDKKDQDLWEYATKDVTPIKKNQTAKKHAQENFKKPRTTIPKNHSEEKTTPSKNLTKPQDHQTDRRTAQKLKRGQIRIDATLDLHGMSKSLAYISLRSFIIASVNQGHKCVLIITGKGKSRTNTPLTEQKPGILKTLTPEWLTEPDLQSYILKTQIAKPKHGGDGAIYVLLRKKLH